MGHEAPAGDLRLANLTKRFGAFTAVDDLSLTIPQGSFFALLGASGCGKTTTLRMIAGLEEPTSGQVLLGDRDIARLRPYKRPVNTVFQSYALFPHLDINENVAFGLRRRGIRKVADQVDRMLSLVQLEGYGRRKPAQLSGGQQQRVALARALINHPQVLLLDEPLGALDLKLRRQMQIELKRIQTEVGITFVHVTHDQEEAMTMADTVAVMNAGRIEQLGAPADLYEFPATAFVANFLGQSNLLAGEAAGTSGNDVLVAAHGARFSVPAARSRVNRGPVFLGVRPEKLHLVESPAQVPAGHQHIGGVVTDASYVGVSTQYLVRTAWGSELSAFAANSGAGRVLPVGAPVVAYWDPRHAFLLGREAGEDDQTTPLLDEPPVGVAS
ncbi:spermidine/putrescine ABC transporter ATP-binding protein [Micromonospora globispora]|uniref:Spermidine/putrescine ABC transporter ATP-binding protein n=1 Tax=Micromonospora globispora TaxID=1450148 RepID=A0A317KIL0_9ACTN|nr:ABC transporter ATP-binding protein [Micromonospora globispora]PWU52795.1 spermidine/putrescine ABC transporter ATP-binding protein [Micromonospora globispora]PWU54549.1 spermidine/putrescine ABC transporter ATP-binding protein [Micromonospora globispora]RQW91326.1 spermidine/putrescine ABC transporter ATP-binding protein [Micromonospora globispora]